MTDVLRKIRYSVVKELDTENYRANVILSDEEKDRDEEIILLDAYAELLSRFQERPVFMANHGTRIEDTLGRFDDMRIVKSAGLVARATWFVKEEKEGKMPGDPRLRLGAWTLAEKGLAAFSVRFIPHQFLFGEELERAKDIIPASVLRQKPRRVYTKVELVEASQVVVPSNPNAVLRCLEGDDEAEYYVAKGMLERGLIELPKKSFQVPEFKPENVQLPEHSIKNETEFDKALTIIREAFEKRIAELEAKIERLTSSNTVYTDGEMAVLEKAIETINELLGKSNMDISESNLDLVSKAVENILVENKSIKTEDNINDLETSLASAREYITNVLMLDRDIR